MTPRSAAVGRRPGLPHLALGLLCACACSGPPPPLPGAERLLQAAGCPPAAPQRGARPAVDLYVDASLSMRGFVTPGSAYVRILEDLAGRLASAGYAARARALCDEACVKGDVARAQDAGRIYLPAFYHGQRTPLAEVLGRLAAAPREGVTLLVSDLEQSAGGTDQRALVAAFRRLAERTPEILLLCFQGPFGDTPRSTRKEGRRPVPLRRFYLLAVAPDAAALAELERLVLRHLPAAQRFQPAQTPVEVREVRLGPQGADPPFGVFRKPELRPCGAGRAFLASFVELRPVRDGEPLRLRLGGDFHGALESPAELTYDVRRVPWPGLPAPGPVAAAAQTATIVSWRPNAARPPKEADALLLSVPAPRPERGSWDVYRIRVRSGGGNLAVPRWAEEGSGALAQGKTPQLGHLVRALQQAITEEVVFLDLFLALGRGA